MASTSSLSPRSQVLVTESKAGSIRIRSPSAFEPSSARLNLKRKRSQMTTITPSQSTADLANMSLSHANRSSPPLLALPGLSPCNAGVEAIPEPPSPVPTEIIDVDAEDFVRTSKQYGVKVRDFAYEDSKPGSSKVPEIWRNPFLSLLSHDVHIRRPDDRDFELPGKVLRRLLDEGLVTDEEAKRHWTASDWLKLKAYDEQPQGPYPYRIAMKRPKPSAKYRISARREYYGEPLPQDISDSEIYMPEDGSELWEGDAESQTFGQMLKKRRLDGEERGKAICRLKSATSSQPTLSASQWSESSSQPSQAIPGPQSQSQSQPEFSEYAQSQPPKLTLPQEVSRSQLDVSVSTPPTTPIALPESPSLNQRSSITNSASATNINDTNNVPHPRRIKRTETFSMLMVR